MHKPPHPGRFIYATHMDPFGVSCRQLAKHLDVAVSTLSRVLKAQNGISPEMALRLSAVLGRSPESWLTTQDNYDLWQAKQNVQLSALTKIELKVGYWDRENRQSINNRHHRTTGYCLKPPDEYCLVNDRFGVIASIQLHKLGCQLHVHRGMPDLI